jgi:hypothetical protein
MGRRTYFGGSSIIWVIKEGTTFGTYDDGAGSLPIRKVQGTTSSASVIHQCNGNPRNVPVQRIGLMHLVIDSIIKGKIETFKLPRKLDKSIRNSIESVGGILKWINCQPEYAALLTKKKEKSFKRKAVKPHGSTNRPLLDIAEASARQSKRKRSKKVRMTKLFRDPKNKTVPPESEQQKITVKNYPGPSEFVRPKEMDRDERKINWNSSNEDGF